jgi:hypothetical protein
MEGGPVFLSGMDTCSHLAALLKLIRRKPNQKKKVSTVPRPADSWILSSSNLQIIAQACQETVFQTQLATLSSVPQVSSLSQ